MTAPDLSDLAELAEAPDGSTPLAALIVVSYLDEDGRECMGLATRGEMTTTDAVGCLAWAQHNILTELT